MADVLGAFEQAVLLAVVRLQRDAYGRAIFTDVQSRLERDIAAGAVHAALRRLRGQGLVPARPRGPPRRRDPRRAATPVLPPVAGGPPGAQRRAIRRGQPVARAPL